MLSKGECEAGCHKEIPILNIARMMREHLKSMFALPNWELSARLCGRIRSEPALLGSFSRTSSRRVSLDKTFASEKEKSRGAAAGLWIEQA